MKKNINYESALQELETIVRQMESGELDLDKLSENLKKAQELIALCKDKLQKTEAEINKILENK